MVEAVWSVLLELAPWLLVGSLVAAVLHVTVPKTLIQKKFSGVSGVARAVVLGVPLPLCSCGVIPAGLGLKKDGASDGATMAFLVSTPQTGVDSIMVSASFLGWPFAIFKVLSAAITGFVAGVIAESAGSQVAGESAELPEADDQEEVLGFFGHALDVLSSIWRWLVFGIVVSAFIEYMMPEAGLAVFRDSPLWVSSLVALVIGLPLYVCATASVPIAASLVHAGLSPGAALVFLMAGPATNVATIGAIYRTLGARNLGIYLGVIVVGSMGFGLLFDSLLVQSTVSPIAHHHHAAWWAHLSAGVLVGLLGWFAVRDIKGWLARKRLAQRDEPAREFGVNGMTCGGCVRKLESALSVVDGVDGVEVILEPGLARVFGDASTVSLLGAIRAAGFEGHAREQ